MELGRNVIDRMSVSLLVLFSIKLALYVDTAPMNLEETSGTEHGDLKETISKVVSPKYMTDLYNIIVDKNGSKRNGIILTADKIRCFLSAPSSNFSKKELSFDIRDIDSRERIFRAELNVFQSRPQSGSVVQRFFQVEIIDARSGQSEAYRMLNSRGGGWKSIDLTIAVKKWHHRRFKSNKIQMKLTGIGNTDSIIMNRENQERLPFLIVYSKSNAASQRPSDKAAASFIVKLPKRERGLRSKRGSHGHPCKRKSMIVDTTKIGWDRYVLAPRIFDAYRCEGKCRAYSSQAVKKQTNHAVLQAILSQLGTKQNGRPIRPPCCAPTQFEHKTLLLHRNVKGQSVIGLEAFTDMVVKTCACL